MQTAAICAKRCPSKNTSVFKEFVVLTFDLNKCTDEQIDVQTNNLFLARCGGWNAA